jgi:hypothetical protein
MKQERIIAGLNSNNPSLKQANHQHIKSSELMDERKKLSLTGKLELSVHHDQGKALSICITFAMHMYRKDIYMYMHTHIHTHVLIC